MGRDVEGRVSAEGGGEHSAVGLKLGKRLIEEIRPLRDRHGVERDSGWCLEEALLQVGANGNDKKGYGEEFRLCLLGLVRWKIFGGGNPLWISSKTEAGHEAFRKIPSLSLRLRIARIRTNDILLRACCVVVPCSLRACCESIW